MDYNDYFEIVSQRFSKIEEVPINSLDVRSMYEEKFEIKWFATKLKNFSFVSYTSKIDSDDSIDYSSACLRYALKNYKGLPRGFQSGVALRVQSDGNSRTLSDKQTSLLEVWNE